MPRCYCLGHTNPTITYILICNCATSRDCQPTLSKASASSLMGSLRPVPSNSSTNSIYNPVPSSGQAQPSQQNTNRNISTCHSVNGRRLSRLTSSRQYESFIFVFAALIHSETNQQYENCAAKKLLGVSSAACKSIVEPFADQPYERRIAIHAS